jgi:hypothetical protein
MANDTPPQQSGQRRRRSHHSPKSMVGNNRPPLRARKSVKNSHTSPSKIARWKRINEALAYREQGHSFPVIAKQMKISISTAHAYVVEGLNLIPLENAVKGLRGIEWVSLGSEGLRKLCIS